MVEPVDNSRPWRSVPRNKPMPGEEVWARVEDTGWLGVYECVLPYDAATGWGEYDVTHWMTIDERLSELEGEEKPDPLMESQIELLYQRLRWRTRQARRGNGDWWTNGEAT